MKRELRQMISKLRKMQDEIFEHGNGKTSLSIDVNNNLKTRWFTIWSHNKAVGEHSCENWFVREGDDYEKIINEILEYLNAK